MVLGARHHSPPGTWGANRRLLGPRQALIKTARSRLPRGYGLQSRVRIVGRRRRGGRRLDARGRIGLRRGCRPRCGRRRLLNRFRGEVGLVDEQDHNRKDNGEKGSLVHSLPPHDGYLLLHGIVSAGVKRMAAKKAGQGQVGPLDRAVTADGVDRVIGTARDEAAAGKEEGGYADLVGADERYAESSQRSHHGVFRHRLG